MGQQCCLCGSSKAYHAGMVGQICPQGLLGSMEVMGAKGF